MHRELASGLSAPIGFKNGTDGNMQDRDRRDPGGGAAAPLPLGVHKNGQVAIVATRGNPDCHVILRGGKTPNYDAAQRGRGLRRAIEAARLRRSADDRLLATATAASSTTRQIDVARDVAAQIAAGSAASSA